LVYLLCTDLASKTYCHSLAGDLNWRQTFTAQTFTAYAGVTVNYTVHFKASVGAHLPHHDRIIGLLSVKLRSCLFDEFFSTDTHDENLQARPKQRMFRFVCCWDLKSDIRLNHCLYILFMKQLCNNNFYIVQLLHLLGMSYFVVHSLIVWSYHCL